MYWAPPAAMPSANVVYPWVQNSHSSGTAIRAVRVDPAGVPSAAQDVAVPGE